MVRLFVGLLVIVLFFPILMPALPVSAHGGHEPPPVNLGGKQASVFVKLDPPILSGEENEPVFLNVRFYDKEINKNFEQVTYRIWIIKDDEKIMQEWFYHPTGDLTLKIVPRETEGIKSFGDREPQLNGLYNRAGPVVIEGPVFVERGLHNLFIEIFSVGTTRTLVDPPLQFDAWVGLAHEETYPVNYNGDSYDIKIRNFYDKIENFEFDPENMRMQFSTPFNWSQDFISEIGMVHIEMLIPKVLAEFNKESLQGTINGFPVPVFVDTYAEENVVVHYTVSSRNLAELSNYVARDGESAGKAVFAITSMEPEVGQLSAELRSDNYTVEISWPEQVVPDTAVPVSFYFYDANGERMSNVTYELTLMMDGNTILTRNSVSNTDGFASNDLTFDRQGVVSVIVDKINGTDESVEMTINVVPEFPIGLLLAVTVAFGVYFVMQKRSIFIRY